MTSIEPGVIEKEHPETAVVVFEEGKKVPENASPRRHEMRSTIKKKWGRVIRKMYVGHLLTRPTVNVENKVGAPVTALDLNDPLRIIALSIQRSIRVYGDNRRRDNSEELELYFGSGRSSSIHNNKFLLDQPSFRCHSYSPELFEKIRKSFGISNTQYYACLALQEERQTSCFRVISKNEASGKSGSFFFFSSDQRFILKSCTKSDFKTLLRILPEYTEYVQKHGSKTLLPRYIGLYGLKILSEDIPDVVMVVMTNFFGGSHKIHCRFDLKGSTYKRLASEKERSKKSPVLKDNDWINHNKKLTFPRPEIKEEIEKQLKEDTDFLASRNLIDYSLLVGIHSSKKCKVTKKVANTNGVISSHDPLSGEVRYFGIVDILTPFRLKKMAETTCTGTLLCRHDISCQPPKKYARRFVTFLNENALRVVEQHEGNIPYMQESETANPLSDIFDEGEESSSE
mmetsp:Transcript_22380/g.33066  ORF Transcript_22380/g.33066 Transcript_22380/m.33066 type:complete len:456 (+) Transcript_22380:51-1418(+)|eukprot:CAMPEP_0194251518 /NCGR_PEP_ID=MMETSP0158-20130606/25541_1 /TAXON_ID=33649 /ORGANISM="Thalassionema nitzschioides, Strain L26-B" /LENGTH=455 /DNA_ID=CAMNT_0038988671 /DNA_START=14 /DNA_END=1381 /DNA_ORIENTATION=+